MLKNVYKPRAYIRNFTVVPDHCGKFAFLMVIQSVIQLWCSSCWQFSRVVVRVPGEDPCLNLVGFTRVDNLKKMKKLFFSDLKQILSVVTVFAQIDWNLDQILFRWFQRKLQKRLFLIKFKFFYYMLIFWWNKLIIFHS